MYISSGADKTFRSELYSWIENYGPDSVWAQANQRSPQLVAKATELIETTLRNYILQQHQTAQNSKAAYSQKLASSGYDLTSQPPRTLLDWMKCTFSMPSSCLT